MGDRELIAKICEINSMESMKIHDEIELKKDQFYKSISGLEKTLSFLRDKRDDDIEFLLEVSKCKESMEYSDDECLSVSVVKHRWSNSFTATFHYGDQRLEYVGVENEDATKKLFEIIDARYELILSEYRGPKPVQEQVTPVRKAKKEKPIGQ